GMSKRSKINGIVRLRDSVRAAVGGGAKLQRASFQGTFGAACLALATQFVAVLPAKADRIQNAVAIFAALDKVTGRVSPLEIRLGQTTVFGALKVTPRACYTRPATETPLTSAFIEVDEMLLDGSSKRIFTGWTFAESPGLHAVEHPTFDVWLTSCKMPVPQTPLGRRPNSPRP